MGEEGKKKGDCRLDVHVGGIHNSRLQTEMDENLWPPPGVENELKKSKWGALEKGQWENIVSTLFSQGVRTCDLFFSTYLHFYSPRKYFLR